MYAKTWKLLILIVAFLVLSGCAQNADNLVSKADKLVSKADSEMNNLVSNPGKESVIKGMADELVKSSKIAKGDMGHIAITSFVDLNQLNKTTHFGRVIGETFFSELYHRGMNVMDFRGQNAISVNADGEFFITRKVKLLGKEIQNKYILVGTYTIYDKKTVINARILDNKTGRVVAASKRLYNNTDCKLLEVCQKKPKAKPLRKIRLTTDGCSAVSCPTKCTTSVCKN